MPSPEKISVAALSICRLGDQHADHRANHHADRLADHHVAPPSHSSSGHSGAGRVRYFFSIFLLLSTLFSIWRKFSEYIVIIRLPFSLTYHIVSDYIVSKLLAYV